MPVQAVPEQYGDPYLVVREVIQAYRRPRKKRVSEVAADMRKLNNPGGGHVGKWDNGMAPYLIEPMDNANSPHAITMAIVGPGQSGKTEIAQNALFNRIVNDPCDHLWYMHTDEGLKTFVKQRIEPMIEDHDCLKSRLGLRPTDDSLGFKRFRNMTVQLMTCVRANLLNKAAPVIIADEYDNYAESLGENPLNMLSVRRTTFGRQSMVIVISHPDRARGLDPDGWKAGIMSVYADSDMCIWYAPCPECGVWSSPAPIAPRVYHLHYPEDAPLDVIQSKAELVCPVNGCVFGEEKRMPMMRKGRWIGRGQTIEQDGTVTGERTKSDTIGYWILGIMSPFVIGGIGMMARELEKATRAFETGGDDKDLKMVVCNVFGLPYVPPKAIGAIDAATIAERARQETAYPLGVVPPGVRFITVAADVQAWGFDWLVRGWGELGENWVIDSGTLAGDPSGSADVWDQLLSEVFLKTWPLADGSGRAMTARGAGFDLSGRPGVSLQAYKAWRRWRSTPGTTRLYGEVAGRELWNIIPLQGTANPVRLATVYPDTVRKANKVAAKGDVPVARFNADMYKDDLAGMLRVAEAAPLYCHFPAALRSKDPPHVWFEQAVAETRNAKGHWAKPNQGVRNEVGDLLVMTHVLAHLHGLDRLPWGTERLPGWAQDWSTNTMLVRMTADAPADVVMGRVIAPIAAANAVAAKKKNISDMLA